MTSLRSKLAALADEHGVHLTFLAGFDDAICGAASGWGGLCVVAYDREQVLNIIARELPGMSDAELVQRFETLLSQTYGDSTPVFIDLEPDDKLDKVMAYIYERMPRAQVAERGVLNAIASIINMTPADEVADAHAQASEPR